MSGISYSGLSLILFNNAHNDSIYLYTKSAPNRVHANKYNVIKIIQGAFTMKNDEIYDKMKDSNLEPADYIALMFDRTDENGILYIPEWNYMVPRDDYSYRCKMEWDLYDCEQTINEFNTVYEALQLFAKIYDDIAGDLKNARRLLNDEQFELWNKYVCPFDTGDFDQERIFEIDEKYDNIEWAKEISKRYANDEKIDDYEKETLKDYINVNVTPEEDEYYDRYRDAKYADAKKRVGDHEYAYNVVLGAQRVCRLFSLGAPKIVSLAESKTFAAAFVLHKYCISRELVDNRIRLNIEKLENMTDEELDEYYRPQKTNSRKSMAPLYVYLILKDHSNNKRHLRQQEILNYLNNYPYEVLLERKALSRVLHNLTDSQIMIHSDQTGTWFEQE